MIFTLSRVWCGANFAWTSMRAWHGLPVLVGSRARGSTIRWAQAQKREEDEGLIDRSAYSFFRSKEAMR